MVQAYVLFNVVNPDLDEQKLVNFLQVRPEVKEVDRIFGTYDVIAKVEVSQIEDLKAWPIKIREETRYVRSSVTMIVLPAQVATTAR